MQTRSLSVMQVISNLDIGGAQEVVRTLAEHLQKSGCQSVVCTFKDGPLRENIERLGIPVEVLPSRRYSILALPLFLVDMLRLWRALNRVVKKYDVDIIQTHLLRALDFLVLSLRLVSDVRVFWTIHNARFDLREEHLVHNKWSFKLKRWGYHLLYGLGARWVNRFIAVSENVKAAILETMPSIPEEQIVTICNGVDVRRYRDRSMRIVLRQELGLAKHDLVLAVVATFKEQKGHRFLLDALPEVIYQYPNVRVLLIGYGELRDALKSQTAKLHLEKHVLFLGNRSDVPALLAASDFFILPSLWEGLPMALIEGMASALPSIATPVSGTNQVMVHGETGLLVTPGNSKELASAMLQLFSDLPTAAQMGRAARDRVERYFSAEAQACEYLSLFRGQLPDLVGLVEIDPCQASAMPD